jgi:hypothetical protein
MGVECYDSFNDVNVKLTPEMLFAYSYKDSIEQLKPFLRRLDSLTEDEFKEFATKELVFGDDSLAFEKRDGYWVACSRSIDDVDLEDSQIIIHQEESDPTEILMYHYKSQSLTHGWITHGETYHVCDIQTMARWIDYLRSINIDLYDLLKNNEALELKP